MLVSIGGDKKIKLLEGLRHLEEKGWDLYATEGTHDFLSHHGVASRCVYKASEKIEPNVTTLLTHRDVDLIINIPRNAASDVRTDGFTIRRLAIDHHIPLITNLQISQLLLQALSDLKPEQIPIKSYREFMGTRSG